MDLVRIHVEFAIRKDATNTRIMEIDAIPISAIIKRGRKGTVASLFSHLLTGHILYETQGTITQAMTLVTAYKHTSQLEPEVRHGRLLVIGEADTTKNEH